MTLANSLEMAPASGGSGAITITTTRDCPWTATTSAAWVAITSEANGQGSGSVAYRVDANAQPSVRRSTLDVNGAQTTIAQEAAPCRFVVTPTSPSAPAAGVSLTLQVSAAAGCSWTATSKTEWIQVTGGSSGSGDGTITLAVAANAGAARNGVVTVADQTVTVAQADGLIREPSPPGCEAVLSRSAEAFGASGGTAAVSVAVSAGCRWTATSGVNWIAVTSGASGTGPGDVRFSVAPNSTTALREGVLTIAGRAFAVTQTAVGCNYSIQPTSQSIGASGGTGSIAVIAGGGCSWNATSNAPWIAISGPALLGTGSGSVSFSVASNDGASRTGTISVADQTFTVTQAAAQCSYAIDPTAHTVGSPGGDISVAVTTGSACSWTAASSVSWMTVTSGASGTGNGTVKLNIASNSASDRTGTATIAGRTFTVTQTVACRYAIDPTADSADATGEDISVSVTAGSGCRWTAASSVSWISVTSGSSGTGNGTVKLHVAANAGASRKGNATIAGQTFTVTQGAASCTYAVDPDEASVGAGDEDVTVSVSAGSACAWTARSDVSWMTVATGASGTGNGTVKLHVTSNAGAGRKGTARIAGRTVTVIQTAAPCRYAIDPTSNTAGSSGGDVNVAVTAGNECGWTATSNVSWVSVAAGASGTGNGTVRLTIASNSGASRNGTATIAGQTFTVSQGAVACSYAIDRATQSASSSGGEVSVAVTTGNACAWTAGSNVPWMSVTAGTSGTGNGTVTLSVASNTAAERTGTATIAGQTFTVTQAALTCSYAILPTAQSATSSGGDVSVAVTAGDGCTWTAISNVPWMSVTSGASGTGNGTVKLNVASNTGAERTGTATIAGQTFTLMQAALACSYAIDQAAQSATSSGGELSVVVTTGAACAWTATSNAPWISVTAGASGAGNGTVKLSVASNNGAERSGTATIAGLAFTVTQAALACSYAINPAAQSVTSAGGEVSVAVTTGAACAWTATSNASWMSVTSSGPGPGGSGTGNGTVRLNVASNTGAERIGTATIAGQTLTVTQAAAPCTYSIAPASAAVPAAGGSGSFSVTAGTTCGWTATANATWIVITAGASGTGAGTVGFSATANTSPARTGTITVAGQTFTVNQDAAP